MSLYPLCQSSNGHVPGFLRNPRVLKDVDNHARLWNPPRMIKWTVNCVGCGKVLNPKDRRDWNRHIIPVKSCAITHTVQIGQETVFLCKRCNKTKVVIENYMGRVLTRTRTEQAKILRSMANKLEKGHNASES